MDTNIKAAFISIIMPAFNAEKYISESIKSVQQQTFTNWELIVVDDGSTDGTASIVKELQQIDARINYIYQPNKKQAAARNTGMKAGKGEWIAFLDSDDLWMPNKLESQVRIVSNNKVDFVFSSGYYLYDNDKLEPYDSLHGKYRGQELFKTLFNHNYIAVLSVMLRKSVTETVGYQDESLKAYGCEDWDYWLRICRNGNEFWGQNERLFKYRVHGSGTSSNKINMHAAGCYVLFKNFDRILFNKQEEKKINQKLKNYVTYIINELFTANAINDIPYFLNLSCTISTNAVKYKIGAICLKLFRQKSKRIINFLLRP